MKKFSLEVAAFFSFCVMNGACAVSKNAQLSSERININHGQVIAQPPGGYLHVDGAKIRDEKNNIVRLRAVNWGFEVWGDPQKERDPLKRIALDGSDVATYQMIIDAIAAYGFNALRFYFRATHTMSTCKYRSKKDHNIELLGKPCIEVIDAIIRYASTKGVRIILDHHTRSETWSGDEGDEAYWLTMWRMLAERYKGNAWVIGADLTNEPGRLCWGNYDANTNQYHCQKPANDWKAASERASNAIFSVQPEHSWLIIVEGLRKGSDLTYVTKESAPMIDRKKLVYSAHVYPGNTGNDMNTDPQKLFEIWDRQFGFIVNQNVAPVFIGEFATSQLGDNGSQMAWLNTLLISYIKGKGLSAAFWGWHWVGDENSHERWYTYRLIEKDYVSTLTDRRTPIFKNWFQP